MDGHVSRDFVLLGCAKRGATSGFVWFLCVLSLDRQKPSLEPVDVVRRDMFEDAMPPFFGGMQHHVIPWSMPQVFLPSLLLSFLLSSR